MDEFLPYLDSWETSVNERPGFTDVEKKKMLLSQPTLAGLRMTGNSTTPFNIQLTCTALNSLSSYAVKAFVELVKYLFTIPGVKVFLSEKVSQDPIEKFFGCQRQRGRVNENPNAQEFLKNTQALRVINGMCPSVTRGNCRGNTEQQKLDVTPLHKRSRPRPKKLTLPHAE